MSSLSCLFDFVPKPDGPASMKEMINVAEKLPEKLIEYEGTVHQAIRNFLGVLTFHLDGPEKALECFCHVLDEDKDNINGLKNRIFVLENIKAASEVTKYKTQLQCTLDGSDERRKQQHLSRFFAEIGFALSFDFQFGLESLAFDERFRKSIFYFEKALKNGDTFEDQVESIQWHFFAARSYHRLYYHCLRRKPDIEAKEQIESVHRFIDLFQCVLNSGICSTYMSRAWSLLGTVFFKMPNAHRDLLRSFITNNNLEREFRNPGLCFQRARHLCPHNAKLVCRHARMCLVYKFWNYSRAVSLLDKSIAMDDTKFNWLAFPSRATAHKREFEKRQEAFQKGKETEKPPRQLLEQAREDYGHTLKLKPDASNRIDLAEVYYLLGKCTEDEERRQHLFERAMCHFQQAAECFEDRQHNHVLYLKQGRCLRDYGEVRAAMECFKMALERDDTPSYPRKHIFRELMTLMLLECRRGKVTVEETAFWLDFAIRKYGDGTGFYIGKLCRTFPAADMFNVCMELVQTRKFETANIALPNLIEGQEQLLLWNENADQINIEAVKRDLETAKNKLESINGDMLTSAAKSSFKFSAQHLEARNNKSKRFDFCVLYSDKDREWVCYSMIPKLEDWYKFHGFLSDRDIRFGTETTDELGQGIMNSVCTVAVISPDFLEDNFLRKMLLCAFQEDDHHILLFQYTECDVPSKVSKLSTHPMISFPDWHALNVKLEELTGDEKSGRPGTSCLEKRSLK